MSYVEMSGNCGRDCELSGEPCAGDATDATISISTCFDPADANQETSTEAVRDTFPSRAALEILPARLIRNMTGDGTDIHFELFRSYARLQRVDDWIIGIMALMIIILIVILVLIVYKVIPI